MAVPQVPERSPRVCRRAAASTPRGGVWFPRINGTARSRVRPSGRRSIPAASRFCGHGREDRPELAEDPGRGAPHRQAVQLVRAVAQRPFADRPFDHGHRRIGKEAGDRRLDDPRHLERGWRQAWRTFRECDDGRHVEVADGDPHPIQQAHDTNAGGVGVEGHLLVRLAQGGRGGIGVIGLRLATREADLARVMPVAGRPFDEYDARLTFGVRVEQDEDRGRSSGPAGARHRGRR